MRQWAPRADGGLSCAALASSDGSPRGAVTGANSSAHATAAPSSHLRKLEESTDSFAHATVGVDLRLAIQQARLAKKLSQVRIGGTGPG